MMNWQEIVLSGLTSNAGEPFDLVVGAPEFQDGKYCCKIIIPGIANRPIYGENALSTLISALRIMETQVYEPSSALVAATTMTEDDYPDLTIRIRTAV
jgi:hypothetical protein